MVEKYSFDKTGRKILPAVHLGNERLSLRPPGLTGEGFVLCEEHGTVPIVFVRSRTGYSLIKCCMHCIRVYCQITTAIPAVESTEHLDGYEY